MKKIFALALCAVMMLSVLAGCGGKNDAPADNTPAQKETERETERDRERETDRETERDRESQRDRETERERQGERGGLVVIYGMDPWVGQSLGDPLSVSALNLTSTGSL